MSMRQEFVKDVLEGRAFLEYHGNIYECTGSSGANEYIFQDEGCVDSVITLKKEDLLKDDCEVYWEIEREPEQDTKVFVTEKVYEDEPIPQRGTANEF